MIPLIGYVDRLSARPGDTLEFKVSSTSPQPFSAQLIKIICADPNPDGPGIVHEEVSSSLDGSYPSRPQDYALGSYIRIGQGEKIATLTSFTVIATIWPTAPRAGRQGIVDCFDEERDSGFALSIDEQGCASVILGTGKKQPLTTSTETPLKERRWYRLWASFDEQTGTLSVGQMALEGTDPPLQQTIGIDHAVMSDLPDQILIAALGDTTVESHFNGKIEAPQIYSTAIHGGEVASGAAGSGSNGCVAYWDFSQGISTLGIKDLGPHGLHGEVVNLPARGMTGSAWRGQEMCWRHAPEYFGAIHFHDDDFYDCAWETDFTFTVPDDFRSGVYAARLTCGDHEDTIPFFVCAPEGKPQSDLCVVIPTFTYVIYSNNARYDYSDALEQRMADWGGYPWNPAKHPDYGLSAYNFHSDGSGICNVSSLRPMMTLKSGYLTLLIDGCASGLRHFQADTHLLAWLADQKIDFDIVTDQELHDDGVECLAPYRAVLTTTHPEYHTARSLDALQGYIQSGGHFGYLGGNGFYWRVALHDEAPGAIEIRRGEGGIRTWASEPGEYYNAFDGEYGGLWRRNGRPPQKIAGVGFSAQGLFIGSYYRRTPQSSDPEISWMFDGIEDEILGDFGLSGGGAAGYELDRVDPVLGSPDNIRIVATSEKHGDTYVVVPEELLTHVSTVTGEPPEQLIRADMSYYDTPSGGAVFSSGSITFCGSLPHNKFDNNISKLLSNVVRRFLEPQS